MEELEKLNEPLSTVIRNSKAVEIPTHDIVVGDLCITEEGRIINADGVIVHSNDFSVNESSLTGESFSVFCQRTEQLNSMRQSIAADFHDQTGNMLAAINRQATVLQLRFQDDPEFLPLIESIISNSNSLYASSKDFLWNLNNDSDNPETLFEYLKSYGQNFYNQFDVDFSASISGNYRHLQQLNSFAALNLIFIFKEVMNNVIKHSGATEVIMEMIYQKDLVTYILKDNGMWKDADEEIEHYGLKNIERRAEKLSFLYQLTKTDRGTSISIGLPVSLKLL